ncbi:hypothetical protein HK102_011524 [Quaeritorhiza haematococci]|nr:hypothetical protein HK102_011524 [Quaeritorhiza haematococci]
MHQRFALGVFAAAVASFSLVAADNLSWDVDAEAFLRKTVDAQRAKYHLRHYTSIPHIAGSEGDKALAEWTKDNFIEYGIPDVQIAEYWPLMNYPGDRSLKLLKPNFFEASLTEAAIEEDPTSVEFQNAVPTFHGYGASGNITAELVYVGYGGLEDFELLKSKGVDVKGKIAIVRYGGMFRGVKVRAADLAGCAGIIIYSDPADDGYTRGKVYPEGPYRPPSAVQRGSVQYAHTYNGDPLTPFEPAFKNATRLPIEESNIAKIPSLPISYEDAEPVQPGPAVVELSVKQEYNITPIWNVIAKIEGAEQPDQVVIVGNHRDAWVMGAVDPNAGSAIMLECARALGLLYQAGWRPARTILLASWDAEEYGLVGSTEWVEEHVTHLNKTAIAYINIDTGVSGPNFEADASPSLANLIRDVTKIVQDPVEKTSVYDQWVKRDPLKTPFGRVPYVGNVGAGSDFVGFLQHVGVSSLGLRFFGPYGVYHSNYDSFHWMEKFGDPTFEYHKAMAEIMGTITLRLATSPLLPFDPTTYAHSLLDYLQELQTFLIKYGYLDPHSSISTTTPFTTAANSTSNSVTLYPLYVAVHKYREAANRAMRVVQAVQDKFVADGAQNMHEGRAQDDEKNTPLFVVMGGAHSGSRMRGSGRRHNACGKRMKKILSDLNTRLAFAERRFMAWEGLPGRTWYRHVVFAPAIWEGYSSDTFPSIREGVTETSAGTGGHGQLGDPATVQQQIDRVSEVIWEAADALVSGLVSERDVDGVC